MSSTVTLSLLHSYYPVVQSLSEYLAYIVDSSFDEDEYEQPQTSLETMVDAPPYKEFLSKTVICATRVRQQEPFPFSTPRYTLKDTLRQAQGRLLRMKPKSDSVLASGLYINRRLEPGSQAIEGRSTVSAAFQTPEWEQLFQRIGVDPMLHILLDTSIFIPLPNGCFFQITGSPITTLPVIPKPPVTSEDALECPTIPSKRKGKEMNEGPPYKRRRLRDRGQPIRDERLQSVSVNTPQDIVFARSRLFFSRPSHVPRTNIIVAGLPPKHILNQIYPAHPLLNVTKNAEQTTSETSRTNKAKSTSAKPSNKPGKGANRVSEEDMQHAENTRRLSKHIFPGQYGLPTPFMLISTQRVAYHHIDREADIKTMGACKTPKRLREILPLIDKLLWRHKKCDYKALQNKACPSKVKEDGKSLDASIILEMMSEESIQLASQVSLRLNDISVDSTGSPIKPLGPSQIGKQAPHKPKFAEFECTHYEVFRFASLVTNAVIPKAFWGSKSNYTLVMKNVKRFIECRRYESFTLHHLLQGFRTADCEWLMPQGPKAKAQGRTTFYITESSAFRNRILYFRHDDWKILCEPLTRRLLETTFVKVPQTEALEQLKQRQLGYSFVRLLPKDTGVRPIVNLKGSTKASAYGARKQSVNVILRTTFDILTYERTARTSLLGASVLGPDQVYVQLKTFQESLLKHRSQLPKLYFVKVDVQAAFDTISQDKLLQILIELVISEDTYRIYKYGQIQYNNGQPKRSWKRKAQPESEEPHFLKVASDLASILWNTIICGLPSGGKPCNKADIISLLQEHITDNMVKIGNHYYKQRVGIPQGSVLSTMLCCFFYGDLENSDERLARLRRDPESLLMRLVDDYLFVTTDLAKARLFLEIMNQGHPEYGCFIGKDKTLTNIDYDIQVMNRISPSVKSFPWCGYLINMKDLSVTVDYSRYGTWGIKNTLTVDRGRKTGSSFLSKMLLLARAKCHVIYSDTSLNTETVVYLNIYQNMLLTALKMQEYILETKLMSRGNVAFLHKAIQRIVNVSYSSAQAQAKRKSKLLPGGRDILCDIKKPAAVWLGYHAFHHVLSRKAQYFRAVLPILEKELRRVQNRCYKRRFKALVKEGQSAFDFSANVV